ncbi:hypothetical protein AYK25_06035 [Thermoplasmatales archaeon SM1-50]|nr:MAG: hypothetical protein AYK25_06035 [Thermoplasmatales archaeon SM1-50]
MKKILSILIITILIICSFSVHVSSKQDKDLIKRITPGDYFRFMIHNFRIRTYRMHIPPSYTGDDPLPLVLVLHGHPSNGKMIQLGSELDEKADEEGFITVYPDGEIPPIPILLLALLMGMRGCWWNAWDYNKFNKVDDVNFIRELISKLQENIYINAARIYITGLSGGALMTYRLGAELSDVIAAIAPVAGSVGGSWNAWLKNSGQYIIPDPSNPIPVVIFHGLEDRNVPYDGGWVNGTIGPLSLSIKYLSVNESALFWVTHNNCNPEPEVNESGNIIKTWYIDGDDNSEVVIYTVIDGGHEWFGSSFFPDRNFSINDNMWEFFKSHPKQ